MSWTWKTGKHTHNYDDVVNGLRFLSSLNRSLVTTKTLTQDVNNTDAQKHNFAHMNMHLQNVFRREITSSQNKGIAEIEADYK